MLGRFVGSALLTRIRAGRLLSGTAALFAATAARARIVDLLGQSRLP
jgi:hypothetical protein